MSLRFSSIGQASDRGLVRGENQDALRVDPGLELLLVADGMGGHAGGADASRIAADTALTAMRDDAATAYDALLAAHAAVIAAAEDGRGALGMGTTCVVAWPCPEGLGVAWVGDSRTYRMHANHLEQLTRDHSEVQLLLDAGVLSREQAARHPARHMLARAIGIGELSRGEVDVRTVPLAPGDRVLLCSDGLNGELDDARIAGVLADEPEDQPAAEALIEAARDTGGHDNVTVIVATAA
ncbi:MAG: protein phosphatase 2C domain-containing protein [Halofilum sp. (in: g-proteobacteria)]